MASAIQATTSARRAPDLLRYRARYRSAMPSLNWRRSCRIGPGHVLVLVPFGHVGPIQHAVAPLGEEHQVGGDEIPVKGGAPIGEGEQVFQKELPLFLRDGGPGDALSQLVLLFSRRA